MTTVDRYRATTKEVEMERAITDLVRLNGGRLFHVRRSDLVPELTDLPDWLIIAPHLKAVALIEAKSQRRIITPGQAEVMAMLAECDTAMSGIVRPIAKDGEMSYDQFLSWLGATA